MTEYSGRTSAYKRYKEEGLNVGPDCIKTQLVFNAQWTNCPVEVEAEVKKLWRNYELGNGNCYFDWDGDNPDMKEAYPLIHEYLSSRGVKKCLIHWWW